MRHAQSAGTIAAYILATICFLLTQYLARSPSFDATAVYAANRAPTFAAFENAELGDELVAASAWADGGDGVLAGEYARASVRLYQVAGDVSPMLPGTLISGNGMFGANCAFIDENTAFKLFGKTDAAGLSASLGGKALTIQGVFRMNTVARFSDSNDMGVAFIPANEETRVEKVGVILAEAPENTADRVQSTLREVGQPDAVEDSAHAMWFIKLLGALPFLVFGMGLALRLGKPLVKSVSSFGYFAHLALLCAYWGVWAIALFKAFGPSPLPIDWIPTEWSNFSQWSTLIKNLIARFAAHSTPILPTEFENRLYALSAVASCALALILRPGKTSSSLAASAICFLAVGGVSLALVRPLCLNPSDAWKPFLATGAYMGVTPLASVLAKRVRRRSTQDNKRKASEEK